MAQHAAQTPLQVWILWWQHVLSSRLSVPRLVPPVASRRGEVAPELVGLLFLVLAFAMFVGFAFPLIDLLARAIS